MAMKTPLIIIACFAVLLSGCSGKGNVIKDKCRDMALIPAGEFLMGSPDGAGEDDEHPQHKVYLDAYYLDKYEVTFSQYDKFCESTGREKPKDAGWGRETRPVINVSWEDAAAYAKWAGKRLPTEAEWEKACRAGSITRFSFGDEDSKLEEYGCYYNFYKTSTFKTMTVGEKLPNGYGIYDMHGNAWEWCSDWYAEGYYAASGNKNPDGPSGGSSHVLRGGSWGDNPNDCRSANRDNGLNTGRHSCNGFRCALDGK